jgi:hypothetical protein
MKRTCMAALFALAVVPCGAVAQDRDSNAEERREITLRGCVVPGENDDTYVLTRVTEVAPPSGSTMPAYAHGRRVVFWLDDDDQLAAHAHKGVEVKGALDGFEESEIELKAGPKDGGLLVEFEGPGKDVVIAESKLEGAIEGAVGTSGREPEKDDIKTMLVKVDVASVEVVDYACSD